MKKRPTKSMNLAEEMRHITSKNVGLRAKVAEQCVNDYYAQQIDNLYPGLIAAIRAAAVDTCRYRYKCDDRGLSDRLAKRLRSDGFEVSHGGRRGVDGTYYVNGGTDLVIRWGTDDEQCRIARYCPEHYKSGRPVTDNSTNKSKFQRICNILLGD